MGCATALSIAEPSKASCQASRPCHYSNACSDAHPQPQSEERRPTVAVAAAVFLQKHTRAMLSRLLISEMLEYASLEYDAATYVQARVRGKLSRRGLSAAASTGTAAR